MKSNTSNYDLLIAKLDRFTRKFYVNQMIRGALFWLALTLVIFLVYAILEHNFYFNKGVRKFFFFSFLAISSASLIYWVGIPLLHYFRLGKLISHEKAAEIIGRHFYDVKDKLINILQLRRQASQAPSPELVFAGIEQKTDEIKLVPFKKAIDLSHNRRYLRYAIPPMLILLALLMAAPSMIKDSTARIIKNDKEFEKAAPFHFLVQDPDALSVVQYEDFVLDVEVEGDVLPAEAFIEIDDYQYRLKKVRPGAFQYRFKNVQADKSFRIFSGRVSSRPYALKVLKKPNLVSFQINLDYPAYTGRKDESLDNIGDIVVPVGTKVAWDFNTLNTDKIALKFAGATDQLPADRQGENIFSMTQQVLDDQQYTIFLSNSFLPRSDSIQYTINAIPDLYPKITVERFEDSTDQQLLFFVGSVGDDYGIRSLHFHYTIRDADGNEKTSTQYPLTVKSRKGFQYDYTFDIKDLMLQPGDELNYFFEVFDNDAVNGSKSTRTSLMQYRMPTLEEFEQQEEENEESIKESLAKSMKESKKLQEEMKSIREKLFQEKDLEWQNKKELQNLLERQKALQEKLQEAQDLFNENLQKQEEFSNPSDELLEKQEKIQEFFEELQSDEMQELLEKFEELLEEMEKNDALEMMENFEMNEEQLEMELDRLLELFKQLEMEQELQEQIDKLNELAEEQENLSEETQELDQEEQREGDQQEDGENQEQEALEKKQEEIQEKFDDVQKDMKGLQDKNQELERPKNLEGAEEQMEKIDQDMQNSMQQLQQQQNKKASQSQKSAAQRMKDLAQMMQMQMQQGQMSQMQEDMNTLRQLLENLVTLSFDQEDIIDAINATNTTTPRYVGLVQDQFKIKDDFKVVEDSLQALSKRVFQIESFITEKVGEIKVNLDKSLDQLEERKKSAATEHQQRTMKNLNDLALMLSEVMQQMQQQMSSMMPGAQMCNKPGGQGGKSGKVPIDKITEGQQQLNEGMKKMQEGMKKDGQGGSSEEFARMAARQAALRKALRDLQKQKQQRGQGDPGLEEIIEKMDKIETDLVNKRLTNEMLKRQAEILTRLLEAERAEREREYDNKRKSETAREMQRKMPPSLEEYIKSREAEIEQYNTVSPNLRPYYKFLVEEYYNALKK